MPRPAAIRATRVGFSSAGLSSLVLQIQAVFTAVFAFAVLGERPSRLGALGMAVALSGIGVAAVDEGASGPLGAFALCVLAAACWGASNVGEPVSGLRWCAAALLIGGVALASFAPRRRATVPVAAAGAPGVSGVRDPAEAGMS